MRLATLVLGLLLVPIGSMTQQGAICSYGG
jgi:hypothetical protein